nr:hypothetical protein Iba_chr14fCG1420 [Ipomoea batatas]GME15151.1 hypothetical protein Iba_scaffold15946CG0150 [Ipomoea batatas]
MMKTMMRMILKRTTSRMCWGTALKAKLFLKQASTIMISKKHVKGKNLLKMLYPHILKSLQKMSCPWILLNLRILLTFRSLLLLKSHLMVKALCHYQFFV